MPVGGTGRDANIQVTFTAEGEQNVVAALRDQIRATKQLREENRGAKRDTRALGQEQKRTARSASDLGRSFRNILLRTVAIIGVLRTLSAIRAGFDRLISTGIRYNETIETSTLSIASLITATADLVDANGDVLEGVQALDVAYAIAEDQVQKLRIAGIQTAATTEQLVNAFQQAVGAGVSAGLTLDEIRQITIRLTQAAGALGVPYRQLNEEIRSLFQGSITPQNTRIATALGITNPQVRAAKEQGRLFEFLNDQFDAFGVAGDRIVETFSALRSTVQETVELLAGAAVQPLFENLRIQGLEQVQRIFDFDTAEIASEFEPLITALQGFFGEIGNLAVDLVTGLVDGLQNASVNGDALLENMTKIGSSISRIVKSVVAWFSNAADIFDVVGTTADALDTIADIMETIANNSLLFKATLLAIGAAAGGLLLSIFGGVGTLAGLAVGALLAVGIQIDRIRNSERERLRGITDSIEATRRQTDAFVDQTKQIDFLTDQYESLLKQLESAVEGSEEYESILRQIDAVEKSLAQNGLDELIRAANGERRVALELLRDELELRRIRIGLQFIEAEAARDALIAEQQAAEARARGRGFESAPDSALSRGQLRRLQEARTGTEGRARLEAIARYNQQIEDLRLKIAELNALLAVNTVELEANVVASEDAADAAKKLRDAQLALQEAIIARDLARAEAQAAIDLENAVISIEEHFNRLREAREAALTERLAIQQQLANEAEDEVERLRAQQRIVELVGRDRLQQLQEEQAALQATEKLLEQGLQAQQRFYDLTGQAGAAAAAKVAAAYDELIEKLRVEGRDDLAGFAIEVRDLEIARGEFAEMTREIENAERALQRTQRELDLLVDLGVIDQREANFRLAESYARVAGEISDVEAELRELIETSQDPELVNRAQELITLLNEAGINVRLLTDEWQQFQKAVRDAAEDTIANHLRDAVFEAENLGDALANLANVRSVIASLVAAIVELTARLIAARIIGSVPIFGAASGGEVVQAASGGQIRGPGGPTADKIPALLSDGEFVVRAASVKKYGSDLFHKLNAGVLPRGIPRFQTGGLVGASDLTSSTAATELKGELAVGLSEGLVLRDMSTPAGQRLILKVITDNRRGIRKSLGVG